MQSLYFIAIVPPQEIQNEVTKLKYVIAEKFESRHALNSPPHITLHMPFKWKDKRLQELLDVVIQINEESIPFDLSLRGFDYFEPRVVFIAVSENKELMELQYRVSRKASEELHLSNGNYKDRPFHPHMTIGFRDLKKPDFFRARKYFEKKQFSADFKVQEVYLLKHDGSNWNLV